MTAHLDRLERRRLERCELLTPVESKAAVDLMRTSGDRDHQGDVLDDGTRVLVTPIVLAVAER